MKDLKKLIERQESITNKVITENRGMTDDEKKEFDELQSKIDNFKRAQDAKEIVDRNKKWADETRNEDKHLLESVRNVEIGKDKRAEKSWDNPADFFRSVIKAANPTRREIDPRLVETRDISGMSTTVDSDGGFVVPTEISNTLIKDTYETGILTRKCAKAGLRSNKITINGVDETSRATGSRWGGIQVYWADEADTATKSKPKFRQIELKLKKLLGLCYITEEMMEDAPMMMSIISQAFPEEFGFMLDDGIIRGNGSGQLLGVLNSGSLVTVAKEDGQAADTIIYENIKKMWVRLLAKYRKNAEWYINQEAEEQLMSMSMQIGTGGVPVYMPAGGISGNPYSTIFGRPVVPIEQCSALGDVGDIILGDFSNYLLATKSGKENVQTDSSIHVRFLYDEMVFRFKLRVDGQPLRNSKLTPYKGSNDLSSFVTLAAR